MIPSHFVFRVIFVSHSWHWNANFRFQSSKATRKMATAVFSDSRIRLFHLLSFLSYVMSQSWLDPNNALFNCATYNNSNFSSSFVSNLNQLFNQKLYDEAGKSRYYNATAGEFPDKVYGLYLCKFDVSFRSCQNCIVAAIKTVKEKCNDTVVLIWFDECMVRYSDRSLPVMDTSWHLCNSIVQSPSVPDDVTDIMLQSFKDIIAMPALSSLKNATKVTNVSSSNTLYTFGQCIPVLSVEDCQECLNKAVNDIRSCFIRRGTGFGRIFWPSCNIGYKLNFSGSTSGESLCC